MTSNQVAQRQERPLEKLKRIISSESVQTQFQNALSENSGPFIASVIDLYNSDQNLQKCDPSAVLMECLKAATLKLPINKQLGLAYVIPYGNKPQFQIGYKGYIQLAMRTGQYRYLNAGKVCEGQAVERNYLTGETKIIGEPTSDIAIGYFCYMELLNGFTKTVYMTREEVTAHGKKFSKAFGKKDAPWQTDFDAMGMKTCARALLSKFGILSIEMANAIAQDSADDPEAEIAAHANSEIIDLEPAELEAAEEPEPAEGQAEAQPEPAAAKGPAY